MTDQEVDHLFWMGFCLVMIQAAERSLAEVLSITLPKDGVLSIQALEADTKKLRRRSLGRLVQELNKRARIDPGLADQLESFLAQRNSFVHNTNKIDLGTPEGRLQVVECCQKLATEANRIYYVLTGILFATYDRIEVVTNGGVQAPWASLPKDVREPLQKVARMYPVLIREVK